MIIVESRQTIATFVENLKEIYMTDHRKNGLVERDVLVISLTCHKYISILYCISKLF